MFGTYLFKPFQIFLDLFSSLSLCLLFEIGPHYVAQAGLKLSPPNSASQVLGLQAVTTTPILDLTFP
jgi:hypothetical protein